MSEAASSSPDERSDIRGTGRTIPHLASLMRATASWLQHLGEWKGRPMADAGTHVFRVSLNPKLYREFEIPSERKLYALAKAIVTQFGFYFDHPFGFYSKLTEFVLDSPVKYELFADMEDIGEDKRRRTWCLRWMIVKAALRLCHFVNRRGDLHFLRDETASHWAIMVNFT
jgi:hypothetical protein